MARQARLPAFAQFAEHYNYNRTPRNHSYYFIYPTDKPFGTSGDLELESGEASLLVPMGSGEGF